MSNLQNLIDLLKSDLRNECTHLMFYLQSASLVQGLHSKEYKEHLDEIIIASESGEKGYTTDEARNKISRK